MAPLTVGVCRETTPGDRRVAVPPRSVREMRSLGLDVLVEAGAGEGLRLTDQAYQSAGAGIGSREEVLAGTDIMVALRPPALVAGRGFRRGQVLVALMSQLGSPMSTPFLVHAWSDQGLTVIGLDLVPEAEGAPRPLDAAASLEQLAGYKAALLAAELLDRPVPAGGAPALPGTAARVVIVGRGHAAREAGRILRSCGAEVRTVDGPPLDLADSDVVITSVRPRWPHRPRILVTTESLGAMRPGSVVVDMTAGADGGSVEGVQPERVMQVGPGVTVAGAGRLTERLPRVASEAYASHVVALMKRIAPEGVLDIDPADPDLSAVLLTHGGLVLREELWRSIMEQTAVAGLP